MSKQGGLGDRLFIAGVDVSGDINSIGTIAGGPAALDVTAINKSAFERIGGVRDGSLEFTSYFNPAQGAAHETFSALPTADAIVTYCRGTTLGNPSACLVGKQIGYDGTRANDGAFTFTVQAQANGYGLEWGRQLTAGQRTDTTATAGSSVDFGAAGTNGLQAYLHVFAFTGTSVTVKLQQSSDDGGTDAFADVTGGAFTTATGVTSERIAVTGNVERYLKVTTTGTFTNAVFAVTVAFNETAVAF